MLDPYDLSVGIIVFNQLLLVVIVFYAIRYFLKKKRLVKEGKVDFSNDLEDQKCKRKVPKPVRNQEEVKNCEEDVGPAIEVPGMGMTKHKKNKNEKLKKWTGKHQVDLDRDLKLVEHELNKTAKDLPPEQVQQKEPFPEIEKKMKQNILDQEIETLRCKIQANKDYNSLEVKKSEVKDRYQNRLQAVDSKLKELDPDYVCSLEEDPKHRSYTTLKIGKELEKVKTLLAESDTDTESFLGKIKKKVLSKQDEDVEELAIKLVKKISKEIEGENPVPENELLWVEDEIIKLQGDINQGRS